MESNRTRPIHPVVLCAALAIFFSSLAGAARGDTLRTTEYRITASSAYETTPTLGNDGTTDLVVFTVRPMVNGVPGAGDIWYRELAADGTPSSLPIQVTRGPTDDELNDVSGDYIVYTAHDSVSTMSGAIVLYQISTATPRILARADIIQEPRIHGDTVVWREGVGLATIVMRFRISWLGTGRDPDIIAGPVPPTFDIQIGSRFAVWSELSGGQCDIFAFDLAYEIETRITNTPDLDEQEPATSGSWIVWRETPLGSTTSRIVARNLDTAELVTISDNGAVNDKPSADGDIVTWESNAAGNLDTWLYRFSTGETFQVTTDPSDQYLNDVFGNKIAYVDARGGSEDIWVSAFTFNRPPVADGGVDAAIVPGGTAALQGSAADPDGDPVLEWLWSVASAPAGSSPTLSSPSQPGTLFQADVIGDYVLSLVAFDGTDWSAPDQVTVTVLDPATIVPVANAGPDLHISVGAVALLVGEATDVAGRPILEWQWTVESSPAGSTTSLASPRSSTTRFSADQIGEYVLSLSARNVVGWSAPDPVSVFIEERSNHPPIASAGQDQTVVVDTVTLLQASATDADGNPIVGWLWSVESAPAGGSPVLEWPQQHDPLFSATIAGDYVLTVIASDGTDWSEPAFVTLHVRELMPPVAVIQADVVSGSAPLTVRFDAFGSTVDPLAGALTYGWDFGDLSPSSPAVAPVHTYDTPGSYHVILNVADGLGQGDQEFIDITVLAPNNPPTASPTATPNSGAAPLQVAFLANAVDPEGDPLTYLWNFGDPGSPDNASTIADPIHQFDAPGTYTVRLTVSDGPHEVTSSLTVVVSARPAMSTSRASVFKWILGRSERGAVSFWADLDLPVPAPDDLISLSFDRVTVFTAPFRAFKPGLKSGVYLLVAHGLLVRIDLEARRIYVAAHGIAMGAFDNTDGVDVELTWGNRVAVDQCWMTQVSRWLWNYVRDDRPGAPQD
jgi:PKD repeat protein